MTPLIIYFNMADLSCLFIISILQYSKITEIKSNPVNSIENMEKQHPVKEYLFDRSVVF